jgi:hypothetical protein
MAALSAFVATDKNVLWSNGDLMPVRRQRNSGGGQSEWEDVDYDDGGGVWDRRDPKSADAPGLIAQLESLARRLENGAYNAIRLQLGEPVQLDLSVPVDPELLEQHLYTGTEYAQSVLNVGLMGVVLKWASGSEFYEACKYAVVSGPSFTQPVPEGSVEKCIIRTIRVAECVGNAARVLGDTSLAGLMNDGAVAMKRGLITNSSLYLKGVTPSDFK